MHATYRHLVYCALLYKGLALGKSHARQVAQKWYGIPDFDSFIYNQIYFKGVRSVPSEVRSLIVCDAMKDRFKLEGVAGFYFSKVWRLNIDPSRAALLRPYRDPNNLIRGLLVYKWLGDTQPRLLTSRNLPQGAKAEVYQVERN